MIPTARIFHSTRYGSTGHPGCSAVLLVAAAGLLADGPPQCAGGARSPSSRPFPAGRRPAPAAYLFVDDLNIVFIVLSTFVGFTTSAFSASYIAHELEIGRLTPSICASTTRCTRP